MRPLRWGIIAAVVAFVFWSACIVASGAGFNPFNVPWNFSAVGSFGDAFGPLNTLMTGIAAIGAIAAYRAQREELDRLKSQNVDDVISNNRRDFEQTFFKLLSMFREIASEIDINDEYGKNPIKGRDAFRRIISAYLEPEMTEDHVKLYNRVYRQFRDDLAHYFRTFYHILKFIDEAKIEDRLLYSRFLRASISEAETIVIALNCMYGGGKEKLKPLVQKYAMLHNISATAAKQWKMTDAMSAAAFGDRAIRSNGMLSA